MSIDYYCRELDFILDGKPDLFMIQIITIYNWCHKMINVVSIKKSRKNKEQEFTSIRGASWSPGSPFGPTC